MAIFIVYSYIDIFVELQDAKKIAYELASMEFEGSRNLNLEQKYRQLWESLEIQNVPRDQIARKGHEMIEAELKKIAKKNNISEPSATKFKNDSWYYELAAKYSYTPQTADCPLTDSPDSSHEKLNENSVCYEERYNNILLYQELKKFCNLIIEQLQIDHDEIKNERTGKLERVQRDWETFFNQKGRRELMEFVQNNFANFFEEWQRCLDARQALLPKMRFIAAAIMNQGGLINDFCTNYFALVKNKTQISPKAYRKFITEIKSYSNFMHWIQDDAWKWNVLPVRCPHCKMFALKTRIYPNGTWDFICTNKDAHQNESQPHFSPNLFRKTLDAMDRKKSSAIAEELLETVGIKMKSA